MKKLARIGLFAAGLFLMGELVVRAATSKVIIYDVEMSRYATTLKQPSSEPRIGHEHLPHSSATLMGVTVRTNGDGLRGKDYPRARTEARRLIFLGDSLTLGWGVEEKDTFAQLTEENLSRSAPTEVLNFGTGNYNTDQEVQLFLKKGLAYQPDEVVLFYFINDAEPTPVMSRWGFLQHSRLVTLFWSRAQILRALSSPGRTFRSYYSGLYQEGQPGWKQTREALATLASTCEAQKIPLKLVILPELHQLDAYPFQREHQLVLSEAQALGVPTLDALGCFDRGTPPVSWWVARDDAHPNAAAHAVIARCIEKFLSPSEASDARGQLP
jgi:lysophospholipase L1-like esterase